MAAIAPPTPDAWRALADQIARLDRPLPLWHRACMGLWRLALRQSLRAGEWG